MLKAILASLTGFASDKTVLETAFALARVNEGHVEALHTRIDAAEAAALAQVAATHLYGTLQEVTRRIGQEEGDLSRAAQNAYAEARTRLLPAGDIGAMTASYREVTTLANEILHQARVHDIMVTARIPELAPDRLDRLVIGAGKPVIIAPARPPAHVGETVAIAWKDTPEAARAVTAALPILKHAKHVVVIGISESRTEGDAEQASADGLFALLKRHAISAKLRVVPAVATTAAEKIKEIAYDTGADLLVMGA